jgi:uncharacterized protein YjgD (DUF1641 family)
MTENNIQAQLDEINRKLDMVMECATDQRLRSHAMEDLIADISLVGKDAYHSSVALLEKHEVEIDPEEFRILAIRLLKNVKNIRSSIDAFESMYDLVRDASPLVKEMIIDFSKKLNDFEQKGYFEFLASLGKAMERIIEHTSAADVDRMADNIVRIIDTIKDIKQPVPEYSLFRIFREMNSPEMKKVFGFLVTFMKNHAQETK